MALIYRAASWPPTKPYPSPDRRRDCICRADADGSVWTNAGCHTHGTLTDWPEAMGFVPTEMRGPRSAWYSPRMIERMRG
jgi:hypothetical protein